MREVLERDGMKISPIEAEAVETRARSKYIRSLASRVVHDLALDRVESQLSQVRILLNMSNEQLSKGLDGLSERVTGMEALSAILVGGEYDAAVIIYLIRTHIRPPLLEPPSTGHKELAWMP